MSWKEIKKNPSPPQRPSAGGYGTKGRPIALTTNHFEVTVQNKNLMLYHYDVAIKTNDGQDPIPPLPKSKNMIIFEKLKESFPKVFGKAPIGYDSVKNAYSTVSIPQLKKGSTYEVNLDPEDGRKKRNQFKVTMVKVNQASLKELFDNMKYVQNNKKELPTTIIQMIEVMFRHYRARKFVQISGRNFFSVNEEFAPNNYIGGGKDGVTGFFGSLKPAAWKDGSILLNLDMAHTAFYKEQPIMDFIKEELSDFDPRALALLSFQQVKKLNKALKGLKIRVSHASRTYKIYEIASSSARSTKFELEKDGKKTLITVEMYMKQTYNKTLRFPNFNLINAGNQNKNIYLPMELCRIEKGQKVKKKLSDREVASFIRSTAVPPAERLRQIMNVSKKNEFNKDPMLKAMTFNISDMPLKTNGRVLPAPSLTMSNQNLMPRDGVWDIRNKKFHMAAELLHWAVLNYDNRTNENTLQKFLNRLLSMGEEKGMKISKPYDIYYFKGREPDPLQDLQCYKKQNEKTQLVMCVLPGRKYYGAIKKAGETEEGVNIVTQCVQAANVFKCQDQTIGNLLLKINTKLGGVNNIVTSNPRFNTGILQFAEPFLIMGADVNHPPAGSASSIPSIAAVVGSYNIHATKYATERRDQYHRQEMIEDLREITKNLLKNFYKKTKHKPKRIIMFRDGVSESQFMEVLSSEMKAMRAACTDLGADYKPGITFICVQKRHHTRLFCEESQGIGRSKNIPPGTIVDRDITHPTETDFFLCSHQGIQGTSRPTHYHLLWDDNDLPRDELEAMTYNLCHVYSRCARAVSIPAPVYYAHHAAFRAKVYIGEIIGESSENGSIVSGAADEDEGNKNRRAIKHAVRLTAGEGLGAQLHYI